MLQGSGLVIVVAGGSGIAVDWSLVHHLLHRHSTTDREIATTEAMQHQVIVLIRAVHKELHRSWIGAEALNQVRNRCVNVIVQRATRRLGNLN